MKKVRYCLFVALILCLMTVVVYRKHSGLSEFGWDYRIITKESIGPDRELIIAGEIFHDEAQELRYSIRQKGVLRCRPTCFGYAWGGAIKMHGFNARRFASDDILVITHATDPNTVLILHDFSDDFSFPRDIELDDDEARFAKLVRRIQEESGLRLNRFGRNGTAGGKYPFFAPAY